MILYCAKCGQQLRCLKTGHGARLQHSHDAFPGDLFGCRSCQSIVIAANDSPVFDPDRRIVPVYTTVQG